MELRKEEYKGATITYHVADTGTYRLNLEIGIYSFYRYVNNYDIETSEELTKLWVDGKYDEAKKIEKELKREKNNERY